MALVALVLLVVMATPASADPARPGRYRGRVVAVEPATDAVVAEVVGGDSFFDLEVRAGHTVVVLDYNQDPADPAAVPYLRFRPDGLVEENRNSLGASINATRFPSSAAPTEAGQGVGAEWRKVAGGGSYVWHDHRAHWMLPRPPDNVAPGDTLPIEGAVPLLVDGQPVVVRVEDRLVSDVSPLPWWLLAVAVAAATIGLTLGLRAGDSRAKAVAAAAAFVAGLLAAGVAVAEWRSLPGVAFSAPVPLGMALFAAATGVVGVLLRRGTLGSVAVLASAACSTGWVLTRLAVFDQPVLVTHLAPRLDRTGTALALGLGAAAAVLAVQRGGLLLHLPDLGLEVDDGNVAGEPEGGNRPTGGGAAEPGHGSPGT